MTTQSLSPHRSLFLVVFFWNTFTHIFFRIGLKACSFDGLLFSPQSPESAGCCPVGLGERPDCCFSSLWVVSPSPRGSCDGPVSVCVCGFAPWSQRDAQLSLTVWLERHLEVPPTLQPLYYLTQSHYKNKVSTTAGPSPFFQSSETFSYWVTPGSLYYIVLHVNNQTTDSLRSQAGSVTLLK